LGFRPLQTLVSDWRPAEGATLEPIDTILLAWPGIVGKRVAQHSAPIELQEGVLLVATRSSAWSQQLQFLEMEILTRLRAAGAPALSGLRFRSGRLRALKPEAARPSFPGGPAPKGPTAERPGPGARGPKPEPAPDLATAFARMRTRIILANGNAGRRCVDCAAPAQGPRCAPCRGERARLRRVDLERLYFNVPWLDAESLASLVPGLEPGEMETIRRGLLQRWWLSLERARRSARRLTAHERQVASSYVILQSGLAPEDVTPAVMRNVLGADLEVRLFGGPGSPSSAANEDKR
jgi:hypothetical protein